MLRSLVDVRRWFEETSWLDGVFCSLVAVLTVLVAISIPVFRVVMAIAAIYGSARYSYWDLEGLAWGELAIFTIALCAMVFVLLCLIERLRLEVRKLKARIPSKAN